MSLRAATLRLTTTPVEELPQIAAYLASALGESSALLSAPENQKRAAGASDATLLVTKLKARITSLLQDKTAEGRWTAVILVKATVEAGQWEVLRGCEPWVRALLTILGVCSKWKSGGSSSKRSADSELHMQKPDPASTKKLSLITLTRIFQLTQQYPTLIREITTPALPVFLAACLNLISVKSTQDGRRTLKTSNSLLIPVFESFSELIPRHPTIFRPFSAQIHSLLLPLIGSIGSSTFVPEPYVPLAQKLFVALHHCAPKNSSGEQWLIAFRSTIRSIHRTGDHLFRSVKEQWESTDAELRLSLNSRSHSQPLGDDGPDPLELGGWNGMQEGAGRIISLVRLLSQFFTLCTHSSVAIPIGAVLDLTARLSSLSVPISETETEFHLANREIGRDEREALFTELPKIYASTLHLIRTVVETLGVSSASVARHCLDQALRIFETSNKNKTVRTAAYRCVNVIIDVIGHTFTKNELSIVAQVIQLACKDLLPLHQTRSIDSKDIRPNTKNTQISINADVFLGATSSSNALRLQPLSLRGVQHAAAQMLISVFTCVSPDLIPLSLRTELDRTAILCGHSKLMMASVLNPIPPIGNKRGHASIVPFLARCSPCQLDVEGLLRPRMPVILSGAERANFNDAIQQSIGMEPDTSDARNSDIVDAFSVSSRNVLMDSIPKSFGSQVVQVETKGVKRYHEAEGENRFTETQPRAFSPEKKPRVDTPTTIVPISSVEGALHQHPASSDAQASNQPLENSPEPLSILAKEKSPVVSSGFLLQDPQNQLLGQSVPATMTHNEEQTAKSDADMASDDEIPPLNIEPDTDEDDDSSL
ncbi:hypothetical protein LOZ12_002422 [Ophidiomyces ophidiicola]|uniref:Uncharacterized protein n=1 Tax=Ophidiomyces ophidiicola TaxID=1387563 RepID=A0ACB8UYA7_9EURO|nr:hypothetical protein LOZ64_002653 [Ophidiomyces ophidiicola]KAI1949506.1 hypothetical protein LOZ62_002257 [Ophidiomyces ophidiicola]KAI1972502.1 hypothetical protein LOZ56_002397 [Ophidiomyces ophidiicola]KAI2008016.1 hypothetical protein LOZ50_002250 [Ophidiomyces ophidiicola]KAI2026055.1 hypothetical protein LOZ45_003108 [Ophidiomyces ophidiicola]